MLNLFLLFRIKSCTIRLEPPAPDAAGMLKRNIKGINPKKREVEQMEAQLRKLAYSDTSIDVPADFFTDSDMKQDYFLTVVYDRKTKEPLLSSRQFFDQKLIARTLEGNTPAPAYFEPTPALNVSEYGAHELFLADRLSGNKDSKLYCRYRNYVFLKYYVEIINRYKGCSYILMARREQPEKLLTKYLRLGLFIWGSTWHNGKEHWILLGDTQKNYKHVKRAAFFGLLMAFKKFTFNLSKKTV